MSIETEIIRLQTAKANIKSAIEEKWGYSIPSNVKMTNYADYVSSATDAQYDSGLAAGGGGGGDIGSKCVVSSGSVVINSANILANAGIASNMTLRVSNGGVASNIVVAQSANAYVLSGGKLVNPIVLSSGTITVSSGGVVSGGSVEGDMNGGRGVMNVLGTVSGTTVQRSGVINVSGNAPVVSAVSSGRVVVFDGATVGVVSLNSGYISGGSTYVSSLTVQTVSGSGSASFTGATGNGVVVSNVDITYGTVSPGAAHFGVVTLRTLAYMNYLSSNGVIDSFVMAGNGAFETSSSYGTIGYVSTMNAGGGLSRFQGTISSAKLDKGYVTICNGGKASNIEILSSGMLKVQSSATANGVVVSSCVSTNGTMYGSCTYGLNVVGSSAIASNVTVLQNGSMYVTSKGFVDEPVLSSGASVYFMSGSASYIESKTGAGVYVLVSSNGSVTSSAITDDYSQNGCNITFACPPKVTVNYVGAGTGYEVSGDGTYRDYTNYTSVSVNGKYCMYNGDANVYKHETKELYLVYSIGYYMLANSVDVLNPYSAYFHNSTGFTSSYSRGTGQGSISVSSFSVSPIGAWSIDDGTTWNEYGSTIATGDAKGSLPTRTITFSNVTGYVTPSSITSTMYDRNNVFNVKYGMNLVVNISGVTDGMWSIDGGTTWNNSGVSELVDAGSTKTITFNSVTSNGTMYVCSPMTVEMVASNNPVTATYQQFNGYLVTSAGTSDVNGTYSLSSGTVGTTNAVYGNGKCELKYSSDYGWLFVSIGSPTYYRLYQNNSSDIAATYTSYNGYSPNPVVTLASV